MDYRITCPFCERLTPAIVINETHYFCLDCGVMWKIEDHERLTDKLKEKK